MEPEDAPDSDVVVVDGGVQLGRTFLVVVTAVRIDPSDTIPVCEYVDSAVVVCKVFEPTLLLQLISWLQYRVPDASTTAPIPIVSVVASPIQRPVLPQFLNEVWTALSCGAPPQKNPL
jgi:hypothetical protein